MRRSGLREALEARTALCGWVSADSPYLAEVLSHSGLDTVTVDLQHGMFGLDRAVTLLQAIGSGPATPMARCPSHDPAVIGKLLDAGAYGIVCPAVDTPQQATQFVRACRYPPVGQRSFGPARGLLYGGPDYVAHADDTILTWAMVESAQAVENLDAILATPGLDGVYVGPNDLALSLGVPAGAGTPPAQVLSAARSVAAAARRAGKYAGVFCPSVAFAREMAEAGFHLVTPGSDVSILKDAVADRVATLRGPAAPATHGTGGY